MSDPAYRSRLPQEDTDPTSIPPIPRGLFVQVRTDPAYRSRRSHPKRSRFVSLYIGHDGIGGAGIAANWRRTHVVETLAEGRNLTPSPDGCRFAEAARARAAERIRRARELR